MTVYEAGDVWHVFDDDLGLFGRVDAVATQSTKAARVLFMKATPNERFRALAAARSRYQHSAFWTMLERLDGQA